MRQWENILKAGLTVHIFKHPSHLKGEPFGAWVRAEDLDAAIRDGFLINARPDPETDFSEPAETQLTLPGVLD